MILQVGWRIAKRGYSNRVLRIFQELLINKSTFKTINETYCESFPSKCKVHILTRNMIYSLLFGYKMSKLYIF